MTEVDELVRKVDKDTDRAMVLWSDDGDLNYAWFGMTKGEVLAVLRHTINDIERGGSVASDEDTPTQH